MSERTIHLIQNSKEVQVISVIRTTLLRIGKGTEDDPTRRITQFWDMDGELLWEEPDPFIEDLRSEYPKVK